MGGAAMVAHLSQDWRAGLAKLLGPWSDWFRGNLFDALVNFNCLGKSDRRIPYYDPVLLHFYRCGSLTSTGGLLIALMGKGKLRWPAFGLSFLTEVFWASAAIGE
jgi:hypothetical protein